MYTPKYFEVTDKQEITAFVEKHGFAQLISNVDGQLFSTHMPFLIKKDFTVLLGHVAKSNPQWQSIEGQHVLVTFLGPHEYISPSWYSSPGVPTWNYQAVHVYGICKIFHDQEQLKKVVDDLTEKYEASFAEPWKADYESTLIHGIVGIDVTNIQAKHKLSQNKPEIDRIEVAKRLGERGAHLLSDEMKKSL